jgi:tetratricopeptide (TPR) repeat protein
LPPVLDNSIAVLPFLNIDGSEETQIFANGLVDDVITRLSRVPRLLVSSRGDAFTLEPNSASELVRQRLRVARYLEGSVQTDGDMLRIIVQMIDSETGFHILSRSFDRPRSDFFEIRDEITALTVANVRIALPQDKQLLSLRSDDTPTLDAYLLYRRGIEATRSALSMDSINESLSWFEQALAVDPEYAAAHAGKCVAYVSGFDEIHVTSMIDKAQGSCSKALQLNPNLDIVHAALGNLYLSIGQFEDAEQSFRRALEIDPASSESYMGLGEVYTGLNRPEDAEYNFRQAVGLRPGDWAPYNNLGNFLYYQGRYGEAAEQYQYAIALDRSNSNAYSNLGAVHMLAGDFAAALIAFQRSIEINPKATAYSNLGTMHYYLGQYDESIENHRTAVSLEPDDHVSRSNLGDALWNSGDRERAREVFQDALLLAEDAFDVNPNHPFTIMILAWIHAMLGDENEARALMDRARSLAPDDPFTHYYDGLVLARVGDIEGAIAALKVAVDSGYPIALLAAEPHLAPLHDFTEFLEIIGAN